jgi:hypothetical protein
MTEKEISFEEALKLPEGIRIRGVGKSGCIEGTTGGSFYNDGHHVGFIRDNGKHDGFSKSYFPLIFILSDGLSKEEEECSNDLCPDCGVKLEWVNLASRCPKCWRVVCG